MSIKTFSYLLLALTAAIIGALTPSEVEQPRNATPPAMAQHQPITTQAPNGKLALNHAHGW